MSKRNFLSFFIVLAGLVLLTGATKTPAKKVYVKTLANGHYQLIVNNRPYITKGVCYNPIPIGQSHDYDWWSDPSEPWKKDGALMKKMGINTVRFYGSGENIVAVKKVIHDLYKLYGIRTIMGHWLGYWNYPAPFYDDQEFRDKVKAEVLEMVRALKDQEGILFWVLGSENNYSFSGKVNPWSSDRIDKLGNPQVCLLARAETYYSLVNELAVEIHKIDPQHPVAMGNGELVCLDVANKVAKDVDILGCIIYRGKTFGNIFQTIKTVYDKPIVLLEFGCDAYDAYQKTEDENAQAAFLESQWSEIYKNMANNPNGVGNGLGGTMFEWSDEWWKHNDYDANAWSIHDTESNWSNGAYYFDIRAERNMNMNEEWFGLVKLDETLENGLNKRIPRKAYYVIREFWKRPYDVQKKNGARNGKKK